jgi:hypothetical protein
MLINILTTGHYVRPENVAQSIFRLSKNDLLVRDFLSGKQLSACVRKAQSVIKTLDELKLLHLLMRLYPVPDLRFEEIFVAKRSCLLLNLDNIEASSELIYFLSTLCLQCFTNEYVYAESKEESKLIHELEANIMQSLAKSDHPEIINLLSLASYSPIHQYHWCQNVVALDPLGEVKSRLIVKPPAKRVIATNIPILGEISDDTSLRVEQ